MTAYRLERSAYLPRGTFGVLSCTRLDYNLVTVEQPWRDNMPNQSCIPIGIYELELYHSPRFQRKVILLRNDELLGMGRADGVPRSYIEIHPANWARDVRGCIGPGLRFNESWGVSQSRAATDMLVDVFKPGDLLQIRNALPGGIFI